MSRAIPRLEGDGPWPLSFAQERLWFLDRFEPKSPLYNLNVALQFTGELDAGALETGLSVIVDRHEALRTTFRAIDGVPVQVVNAAGGIKLDKVELATAGQQELDAALTQAGRRIFDLERDRLIAATLFRLGPEDHVLLLCVHHIAFDGWSFRALSRELQELYTAARAGRAPQLNELRIQYKDYAVWQREWLQGEVFERELAYWTRTLAGIPSRFELPADRQRPAIFSYRGGRIPIALPRSVYGPLRTFAAKQRASQFMVLLANFQALLHRFTGETDICIGSPVANRGRVEIQDLIGFFANTLPLRTDISGEPGFRELVRRVWQTTIDGIDHQNLPFEKLVERLQPERDLGHTPFFSAMFGWRDAPSGAQFELPGLRHRVVPVHTGMSKFDLTLFLEDTGQEIAGSIEYNTDLFEAATISRLGGHYGELLQSALNDPDTPIRSLRILSSAQRNHILKERNQTATAYPDQEPIQALFEAQAARRPDAPALRYGNEQVTYGQLNARANRIAHWLIRQGVQRDDRVGVRMVRAPELAASMLGILKAGGAYVPLDPAYPPQRLEYMQNDAGLRIVLTEEDTIADESDVNPPRMALGDSVAYVIYTSGSTGSPNGVSVTHRAVNRLVRNTNYIELDESDVVAQAANCSFDAATFEFWGALLNGGCLEALPLDVTLSPEALRSTIVDRGITVMFLTTALFNQMALSVPAAFRPLRVLLFGGEASDPRCVEEILRHGPPRELLHVYGPTETTTFASWHRVTAVEPGCATIPIGRPISNTTLYVLDPYMQPVADGTPGELYIGGPGVARGYLNRPDLTARRFVPDSLGPDPSAFLFKSGDKVRYRSSGDIEFLGRFDEQVKLRGFRIERREIEAALSEHPRVKQALIQVQGDSAHNKRLIAYVIARGTGSVNPADLRDFLRQRLPQSMLPSAIIQIDAIPLTPNGKVDKDALPTAPGEPEAGQEFLGPRDPLQFQLSRIWEDLLGVRRIDVRENFFDAGGHSLLAVRLLDRIEKECGKRLPLATFFSGATIEKIADAFLRQQEAAPWVSWVEVQAGNREQRPPFVFLHGDFVTGGLYCLQLARAIGLDQPFYTIQPHGLDGREVPPTIEEMAADHVKTLLAFQPEGPYLLGGHCNGGTIAFEMARILRQQNRTVGLLAVVQGWAGRAYTEWEKEWDPDPWDPSPPDANSPDYYKRRGQAYHRYTRAMWVYRPQRYPGRVTLLWPEEDSFRNGDSTAGWGKVADAVELFRVAGGHLTAITTEVRDLAAKLRSLLDAAIVSG